MASWLNRPKEKPYFRPGKLPENRWHSTFGGNDTMSSVDTH
jgi:hypothetical protein